MSKVFLLVAGAALTFASSAHAADLPRRAIAPETGESYFGFDWTGTYAGVNLGYGQADDLIRSRSATGAIDGTTDTLTRLNLDRVRMRGDGFVGGGQIGYNRQLAPGSGVVVGVETDLQYTDLGKSRRASNSYSVSGIGSGNYSFSAWLNSDTRSEADILGTLRGRIGFGVDRILIYGTAGLAYGNVSYRGAVTSAYRLTDGAGTVAQSLAAADLATSNHLQLGYAFGGGVEYAIPADSFLNFFRAGAVTAKVEYLHYDLGTRVIVGDVKSSSPRYAPSATATKIHNEGDIFRAGINYRFGVF